MSPRRRRRLARTVVVLFGLLVLAALLVGLLSRHDDPTGQPGAAAPAASSSTSAEASTAAPSGVASGTPTGSGSSTAIPEHADGTFTVLPVPGPQSTATGRVVRYDVEIENGITVDRAEYAKTVRDVLLDPRGWQIQDKVRFVNVSPEEAARGAHVDVHVTLATPDTVDKLCAPLRTQGQVSCYNKGRSVLNLLRWDTGVPQFGTDVARYRIYQINHEVGHAIGHGHAKCPGRGAPAPVMLQQTLSLQGCTVNTWPTVTHG